MLYTTSSIKTLQYRLHFLLGKEATKEDCDHLHGYETPQLGAPSMQPQSLLAAGRRPAYSVPLGLRYLQQMT
eukprot:1147941-Pelagomonas_calceolata.AAC.4